MKKKVIVLTAGGTGGHIFPAEALATWLQKEHKEYRIEMITDKRAQKNLFGTLAQCPVHFVQASAFTGRRFFKKVSAIIKLGFGTIQAIFILMKIRPKILVGFGGYASMPAVVAAQFLHIPVVLHEQNAILGRANRFLAHRINLIATSFNPTERIPSGIPCVQTGMPVRAQIQDRVGTPYPTDTEEFRLLIMGGSQGAHAFSELLPKALVLLPPELKGKLVLTQQVRSEDMEKVKEEYRNSGIKSITLSAFFTNIPELLSQTHLVVSRSGSSSLAEFSAMGRPALLIPLPTSADDHQTANARVWTANGSGWLVVERDSTPEFIASRIAELMDTPLVLQKAAKCAILSQPKISAQKALGEAVLSVLKDLK